MSRVVPLPPLTLHYDMSEIVARTNDHETGNDRRDKRRLSTMSSSNPQTDIKPVDCILVYSDKTVDSEVNNNNNKNLTHAQKRENFEIYLQKKQGLILEKEHSLDQRVTFVKIHAPFEVLRLTAENIRMRLPIEIIDEEGIEADPSKQIIQNRWDRFNKWMKKPFRLDSKFQGNEPDYYTAVYSSHIEKFRELFDTLRGSREQYFTPSERSLLTYELLSRAHYADSALALQHQMQAAQPTDENQQLNVNTNRRGIDRLISNGSYLSYFPLHESLRDDVTNGDDDEMNDREKLKKHWATMRRCLKFQPLDLVRSYMGEKVAFYFAAAGFYTQMLIPAAIVGLIIFIYGAATVVSDKPTSDICGTFGKQTDMCPVCDKSCKFWKLSDSCIYSKVSYVFDNAATVVFAALMSLWARWFVEMWKRRQSVLQFDWDSIDFEEQLEPIRPEFESKAKAKSTQTRINPVTAVTEPYVPTGKRFPFYLIAIAVVVLMMAVVCATVFGTIVYRIQIAYLLKDSSVKKFSSIIITVTSALINLICSLILSKFYYWIARKLTDLELHKYQSTYDDSLTIKIYLFQFVNFYSSLFYIAFFKGRFLEYPSKYGDPATGDYTEQCDPAGCLVELSIQFIIIMIGKQIVNNLLEFGTAIRRNITSIFAKREKNQEQWEKDNELIDFNSYTLLDEYLELVIQFGFVTLFVTAFPLAPLFALFNNIIELRLDAWKFLSKYRRPIPFKAADIGIWSDVLSGISYLAVLTNALVIAWTSEFIPKMVYRSTQTNGVSLENYVNWTLSVFPISGYNESGGTTPLDNPANLTYCRYREFRESTPNYIQTSTFWNVTAARLAFIIVFEHLIFFIVYVMQWIVPDVPKKVQDKIDRERFIDQRERWSNKKTEEQMKDAAIASTKIMAKMMAQPKKLTPISTANGTSNHRRGGRKGQVGIKMPTHEEQS